MAPSFPRPEPVPEATHSIVYRDDGAFCSWPFNAGTWQVGPDEVVTGFFRHDCDYGIRENLHDDRVEAYGSLVSPAENRRNQLAHARIETYGEIAAARTVDGGRTWEPTTRIADNVTTSDRVLYGAPPAAEAFDPSDPDTLVACWSAPNSADPTAQPWIRVSEDGGRSWSPPRRIPLHIFDRIQGRPSYLVRPDGAILLFLSGKTGVDNHDRPVVYGSFDGGRHWTFLSFITGRDNYRTLCPSPTLLDDGTVLAGVRCKPSVRSSWTELHRSADGGRTWSFVTRINDTGAPGHLLRLSDGRLCCTYGYRQPPYGIRLRMSDDDGETWGREWILRDDGGSFDLGYPRTVELDDGTVLAVYYFNGDDPALPVEGGVRYIAASRFTVPS